MNVDDSTREVLTSVGRVVLLVASRLLEKPSPLRTATDLRHAADVLEGQANVLRELAESEDRSGADRPKE